MLSAIRRRRRPEMDAAVASAALPLPAEEARLLLHARPNVLLAGPPALTAPAVAGVTMFAEEPVTVMSQADAFVLPDDVRGTLVIEEVARLTSDEQQRLLAWLDAADTRTQIVSTTAQPLYALVEVGQFLDRLYYRLNVVKIGLGPQES